MLARLVAFTLLLGALLWPAEAAGQPVAAPGAETEPAYLTIRVSPPEARISIDGREQPHDELEAPFRLTPGRHRIEARLAGHGSAWREVDLKPGRDNEPVALRLAAQSGDLSVRPLAEAFQVIVDGRVMGLGSWEGPLPAGLHEVRVVGGEQDETIEVEITAGELTTVSQAAGGRLFTNRPVQARQRESGDLRPPKLAPPPRGIYVMGYGAMLVPLRDARDHERDDGLNGGPAGSLRLGYRFLDWLGAEALFQYAALTVNGTVPDGSELRSAIGSARIGAAARLMLPARSVVRFVGTLGGGAVWSFVNWQPDGQGARFADVQGWDGFGQAELGVELEWYGWLADIVVQNAFQTTDGLATSAGESAFGDRIQFIVGPAVSLGYGFW
jgi:hypothetical protein